MPSKLKKLFQRLGITGKKAKSRADQADLHDAIRALRESMRRIEGELASLKATSLIQLFDLEMPRDDRFGDRERLLPFHHQVCSQNGEDGIIQEIFRRIGTTNQIFAEVGVGDGCESNTAFLLSQGWTGFWIDGEDAFVHTLKKHPHTAERVRWLVEYVSRESIAEQFRRLQVPQEFDLLSLDIDHNTWYAWEGLAGFRPRVAVIEYNSSIPPGVDWKVHYAPESAWDGTHNFGASLDALTNLGSRLGYSLVGCEPHGVNAFFVRNDLVGDKFKAPYTAANHYEPPRYSLIHRRGHRNNLLDPADRS